MRCVGSEFEEVVFCEELLLIVNDGSVCLEERRVSRGKSFSVCFVCLLIRSVGAGGDLDAISAPQWRKRIRVELSNPLGTALKKAPVVLPVKALRGVCGDFRGENRAVPGFIVVSETGEVIPSQVDDVDLDGEGDEIVFTCDVKRKARSLIYIYYAPRKSFRTRYPAEADCIYRKKIFDDGVHQSYRLLLTPEREYTHSGFLVGPKEEVLAGWESRQAGFIWEGEPVLPCWKLRRDLQLHRYLFSSERYLGVARGYLKPMKRSGAFGCGGWHLVDVNSGKLLKPLKEELAKMTGRVVASGPVRAILELEQRWEVRGEEVQTTWRIVQWAHKPFFEAEVLFDEPTADAMVAVGISASPEAVVRTNEDEGLIAVLEKDEQLGTIQSALTYDPEQFFDEYSASDRIPKGMSAMRECAVIVAPQGEGIPVRYFAGYRVSGKPQKGTPLEEELKAFVSSVRNGVRIQVDGVEPLPLRRLLPEGEWYFVNPASSGCPRVARLPLAPQDISGWKWVRSVKVGGGSYPVQLVDSPPALLLVAELPPMSSEPGSFQWAKAGSKATLSVRQNRERVVVNTGSTTWSFSKERIRVSRRDGQEVVITFPGKHIDAVNVEWKGAVACLVNLRSGAETAMSVELYAGPPLARLVLLPFTKLEVSAARKIDVARYAVQSGGIPQRVRGDATSIFYPGEWAMVWREGSAVWFGTTPSAYHIRVERTDLGVSFSPRPHIGDRTVYFDPESSWSNRVGEAMPAKVELWLALAEKQEDGWELRDASAPLFLARRASSEEQVYLVRYDFDHDGALDTVRILDMDNDGPDLLNDTWEWDVGSDGSLQSRYVFVDSDNDGTLDDMRIYGDLANFFVDHCLDRFELDNVSAVVHNWNGDRRVFLGSVFEGGNLAGDAISFKGFIKNYAIRRACSFPGVGARAQKVDDLMKDFSRLNTLDLDGDGDWDVSFADDSGYVNLDYGDVNPPLALVLDPTTGFICVRDNRGYQNSMGNLLSLPVTLKGYRKRPYLRWVGDYPQCDLNLDDSDIWHSEVHWMGQTIRNPDEVFYYQVCRMTLDLDKDFTGVRTVFGTERGFDICVAPSMNITPDWRERMPVYPARKLTLRDRAGNEVTLFGPFLPESWDGKKLSVFDRQGRARKWVDIWEWTLRQEWDFVGLMQWRNDPNPEAMQIFPDMPGQFEVAFRGDYNFNLYYSPLDGSIHLRGSAFCFRGQTRRNLNEFLSYVLGPKGYDFRHWALDVDFSRGGFKSYFSAFDLDKDGYLDTYLYDGDGDALYERRLWYERKNQILRFALGDRCVEWKEKVEFPETSFRLEDYSKLSELYRRSLRERGLLYTLKLGDGSVPSDAKEVLMPVIGVDAVRARSVPPWSDTTPGGFSRLFKSFSRFPFRFRVLSELSEESLRDLRILIIADVKSGVKFKDTELKAVESFVKRGGLLLAVLPQVSRSAHETMRRELLKLDRLDLDEIAETGEEEVEKIRKLGEIFLLLRQFDVERAEDELSYTAEKDSDLTEPDKFEKELSPGLFLEDSPLMRGFRKVYFHGFPLNAGDCEVLFSFRGRPLIVAVKKGKGYAVFSGSNDLLSNEYSAYGSKKAVPPFDRGTNLYWGKAPGRQGMNTTWLQPENGELIDALTDWVASRIE